MLEKLKTMLGIKGQSNLKLTLVAVTVAVLILASIYAYKTYVVPRLSPAYVANQEYISTGDASNTAQLTLYSASWCPHCVNLKKSGVWDEYKQQNNGKVINGYTLIIVEEDCSNDTDTRVQTIIKENNVNGFPSIKLIKDGSPIDFDAKPTIESLTQFINTVL